METRNDATTLADAFNDWTSTALSPEQLAIENHRSLCHECRHLPSGQMSKGCLGRRDFEARCKDLADSIVEQLRWRREVHVYRETARCRTLDVSGVSVDLDVTLRDDNGYRALDRANGTTPLAVKVRQVFGHRTARRYPEPKSGSFNVARIVDAIEAIVDADLTRKAERADREARAAAALEQERANARRAADMIAALKATLPEAGPLHITSNDGGQTFTVRAEGLTVEQVATLAAVIGGWQVRTHTRTARENMRRHELACGTCREVLVGGDGVGAHYLPTEPCAEGRRLLALVDMEDADAASGGAR